MRVISPEESNQTGPSLSIPKPQTEEDLRQFLWHTLEVRIPAVRVRAGHASPWEAFAEAYFATVPVSVWLGARGLAGKTFMLSILGWVEAVTLRASVSILGGSSDQSEKVLEYLNAFWRKPAAPTAALDGDPALRRVRLIWGNQIKALAASQRAARGGHPERLRLDEADEMDLKLLHAVLGQPMSRGSVHAQTVISSTHHNPDGTMTEVLRMAQEKGWPVRQWGYPETLEPHGWLTRFQLERSRQTMPAAAWEVEVEMNEPSAEGRAIVTDKVEATFSLGAKGPDGRPLAVTPQEGQELEFEPPVPPLVVDGTPVARATYATGADWGQTGDYTEIVTFRTDVRPLRLVAYRYVRRRPYPEMVAMLDARLERYPGTSAHDYTGVGRVGEFLRHGEIEDVTMVGRVREDLFRAYILALERDEIRAPRIQRLYQQHKFVRRDDLYGSGHPPDGFVACAMANKAAGNEPPRLLFSQPGPAQQAQAASLALASAVDFFGSNGHWDGEEPELPRETVQ